MILDLKDLKTAEKQYYLQHVVAPRPVCFASTIDKSGNINLSPFSFFNLFSSNPPIVIFSPSLRVRDNTTKHTLENVIEVPEVVINIVTYEMVHQVSLASCEYPKEMNEFEKALGVGCDFCHVKPADSTANWDMALDDKPEKNIARKMIEMSNKINKDFFNATTKYGDENALLEIHCVTCHHGEPHPEFGVEEEQPKEKQR